MKIMNPKFNKKTRIFCDGANQTSMFALNKKKYIKGFTTNPTLMRSAGIKQYLPFAYQLLKKIKKKPISFEVFSDDIEEMYSQAKKISRLGKNVYVKIPITNTQGISTISIIKRLLDEKIKVNITAVFSLKQVNHLSKYIDNKTNCIISIFAGRIADTGVNPEIIIKKTLKKFSNRSKIKILWASTRELFNIYQAIKIGCHIVTVPISMLDKLNLFNKNLDLFSIETVRMFYRDAKKSGYVI